MKEQELKSNMNKSVEATQRNFNTIRTGRANSSLLDRISVEYYGAETPIKSLASITTVDSQTISIQPFDLSCLQAIEKSISMSDLGITPNNDGKVIRINVPPLTEERRVELSKRARGEGESARVSIRNARKDANDLLKSAKEDGLSEDMQKTGEAQVQDLTNSYIGKVEAMLSEKEADIMTI